MTETETLQANKKVIARLARKYRQTGAEREDLEQEGAIGFLKGVRKWNPDGGASLRTYAAAWAESYIRKATGCENNAGKMRIKEAPASLDEEDANEQTLYDSIPCTAFESPFDAYAQKQRLNSLAPLEREIVHRLLSGGTVRSIGRDLGLSKSKTHEIKAAIICEQ